jgi:hypothetical protein
VGEEVQQGRVHMNLRQVVEERLYGVVLKEVVAVVGSYWVALKLAMAADKALEMQDSQVATVVVDTEKRVEVVVALLCTSY